MYETGTPMALWRRYGTLLGVMSLGEVSERLDVAAGREIGVIHLEGITEFDRPVTVEELRANGITFGRPIVSGRKLDLTETATLMELGGYGARIDVAKAAEAPERYRDAE